MKRLEVIIKRHDQQMLAHHKAFFNGSAPKHNMKIWNETIRELESWKSQQCEEECNDSTVDE